MSKMEEVTRAFGIPTPSRVTPVDTGLIHRTYRADTERGSFVLQRLHDVISDASVDDMYRVTEHVQSCGIKAPALLRTTAHDLVLHADSARWRAYPWIVGSVFSKVESSHMAREAGRIAHLLHSALGTMKNPPQGSIPHFHDTHYVLEELNSVLDHLPEDLRSLGASVAHDLPSAIVAEEGGAKQLIHGDLKISNILFDESGSALGVIDFDTVLVHYTTIDMGDALRSWCNRTEEGNERATFATDLFEAALQGYLGSPPTEAQRTLYLRATRHITLELTARFLVDVVRDSYFGWDSTRYPSRVAHNAARARGQFSLARSIPL